MKKLSLIFIIASLLSGAAQASHQPETPSTTKSGGNASQRLDKLKKIRRVAQITSPDGGRIHNDKDQLEYLHSNDVPPAK